ncbi:archaea-specific SMC-related protein [Natrinema gelatinilyticum]|uniref:archaea-specific SMC-related protein n=1 Tax=Natrinema gelatinilyticum TaxID=2961571 RepID=UPI0020C1BDE5|nr:archaea-specific SMC-related protein [Natrinema gelatinilyticum]
MTWHLSLENIAGIRSGEARIDPGVNAVRASNWQGKSSFLSGIKTVFGTDKPLTEGQDRGRVVLDTDESEFAVDLHRTNGSVTQSGKPYLTGDYERECADLFSFLDEDNEIRGAVRTNTDLEELLTRPLDFENIEERIADLRAERDQVESELERAKTAADRLPTLQERVTGLESDLEELQCKRASLDADDTTADNVSREELSDLQAERNRVSTKVERLENTLERLNERLSNQQKELESLSVPAIEDVEDELAAIHDDLRDIERDRELLQSVFEANKRIVDEGRVELLTDISHEMMADAMSCWICGQETTRDSIESQLDALDQSISGLRKQAQAYRTDVEELEAKRDEAKQARRRRSDLESEIADLEARVSETETSLEAAETKRADLDARIETLGAAVDETRDRITDVESDIKYTEAELADARDELETTKRHAEQRNVLADEYESITEEITGLRNRKKMVKDRTREAFSAALEDLLSRFETGFETARLTANFDLIVAREGREADLNALSEGERELLGIVAALAGHEAFEVGDIVPVMLLDGLGGLASDNLEVLVEYLADRTSYLVLTAYPEHASFDAHELSPTDWQVVSHSSDVQASS